MKRGEPEIAWYGGGGGYADESPPPPPEVPDEQHRVDRGPALSAQPGDLRHVGLVMGRFRPPHLGHLHLVEEAFRQCGRLYVYTPAHHILGRVLAHDLVSAAFSELATITVSYNAERMPRDPSEPGFAKAWADSVRTLIPNPITRVFSSDTLGAAIVAQELGAQHVIVDTKRERVPICASDIRADLFAGFRWIVPAARPRLALQIGLLGPECAGKTSLARELQAALRATVVEDGLRIEAAKHRGELPFEMFAHASDTLVQRRFLAAKSSESGIVVVDDSRLLAALWAQRLGHKLNGSHARYLRAGDEERFDVTLVCHDDFGFVGLPERDHPELRAQMMRDIEQRVQGHPHVVHIRGTNGPARVDAAIAAINEAMARRRAEVAEALG